jgi:hypothetical protein
LVVAALALTGCSDDAEPPPSTGTREAFCLELRASVEQNLTVFDPEDPATPEQTRDALERLAAAAPPAVAADVQMLAGAFAAVADALAEIDPGDPDAAARLDELELDEAAITRAQEAVNAYVLEACGVDLEALNAASVPTTVPVTTAPPTTLAPATTTVPG